MIDYSDIVAPGASSSRLLGETTERLAALRDYLHSDVPALLRRLRGAHAQLGLVKRKSPPQQWTEAFDAAAPFDTSPISVSLMPLVLPDEVLASATEVAAFAAHSEEFSAFHRPVEHVVAHARQQAWPAPLLDALLGDQWQTQARLMRSFHRGRVDLLFDLPSGDLQSGLLRLAAAAPAARARALRPIEVNNGGSQGHWIATAAQALFERAFEIDADAADAPSGLTPIDAMVGRVYRQMNAHLQDLLGPATFAQLFPSGRANVAFVSGPYSGRLVNDIEGPRIAAWLAQRFGIATTYNVGFEKFETVAIEDRLGLPCALLRRRGGGEPMAVWGEFYVTDSLDYTARCRRAEDLATQRVVDAVLAGEVLGVTSWPGREVLENDKTHACDKADAIECADELGLSPEQAELLQAASPAAYPLDRDAAFTRRVREERESWVVKARFGCGGSTVIVGPAPSFPTQRLPRIEEGGARVVWVALQEIAQRNGVAIAADAHGRLTCETWVWLWPHLVNFAAASPGYYIAQHCVAPRPFDTLLYDGQTLIPRRCHVDLTFTYTTHWVDGLPRIEAVAPFSRAAPWGYPHSNINARGGFVPLLSSAQLVRLTDRLGV